MDLFSTLPTECLLAVAHFVLPDTLFSMALTCKRVYECLQHLVEAQKKFAEKYCSVDTRHPLSAVTALRRILIDPIAAWHLRSINLWRIPLNIAAWDDRAGQDDIEYLSCAFQYPHVWTSAACKQVYKTMRERWRDFNYLKDSIDASRGAAFVSSEEIRVFESLLEPFSIKSGDQNLAAGGPCRVLFLLIACAPRLRDVWHARPNETWLPWHNYLGRFFREFDSSTTGQQKSYSSQDSRALSNDLRPQLPPGSASLRYVDLGEATPFGNSASRGPVRIHVVRSFLVLPNLELLRFAHAFHRLESEDLRYTFEWEPKKGALRESLVTFIDMKEGFTPLNRLKYWPMKVLSTVFGKRIVSYECSAGTVQDVKALHLCAGQTLESLTFINDTPDDLGWLLRRFSNLKTLTIGINYLTQHEGSASCDLSFLPTSLEHLMIHSGSHASKRPRGDENGLLQWAKTMYELGCHLVSTLYWILVSDQLPNLQSMCLIQIWGESNPDLLDSLITLTAERRINLHLWSGSPDPDARTCAHLCGRFVPTGNNQICWYNGSRSWNFYSTYNWVTGKDELQYGNRCSYRFPQLNDEREMPTQFLHEWNEDFFKDRLRELYTSLDESDQFADLSFTENGLDFLDSEKFGMLVDNLCERYRVKEDKAMRVKDSMELGRKVVDRLGGEGGRLVCRDFKWQRVYD